jgi:autotransporter-associated beta strand protein
VFVTGDTPSTFDARISHSITAGGVYNVEDVTGDAAADFIVTGEMISNATNAFTKNGAGTMEISNADGINAPFNINQGTLAIAAAGSMSNAVSINIADGAFFDVTANSGFTLTGAQTLTGAGTQLGNLVSNGTIAPGTDTGTLTIDGNATLNAGSALVWQIADWTGGAPGTSHDLLVADEITITATDVSPLLIVIEEDDLINFSESNASFTIASAASGITGLTVDNVTLNTDNFSGGGTWEVTEDSGNLILTYSAQAETPFESYVSGFGLVGAAAGSGADPDNDGIANALEFVLGGDPSNLDTSILPTATTDGNNLTFTFRRNSEASGVLVVF